VLDSIENIKLKDMGKLKPEQAERYGAILRCLKPKSILGTRKAKNIFEMQFAEVENMRRDIGSPDGMFKAMCLFYDCPEELLTDYRIIQFYHALNHLLSQIEHLDNIERQNLYSKPKQEDIDAGIREFDRFSSLNVLDDFAKDYGKSPLEVEQWPYGLIYSLMWRRKVSRDFEENKFEAMKTKK